MNDSHDLDGKNAWTLPAYIAHNEALRQSEEKFQAERDRRYKEVSEERDKALKIKEAADERALILAREIQAYRDEMANGKDARLQEERREMATQKDIKDLAEKVDVAIKPLAEYVTGQQGRQKGIGVVASVVVGSIATLGVLFTLLFVVIDRVAN